MTNTDTTTAPVTATGTPAVIDGTYRFRTESGKVLRAWWVLESIDADGIATLCAWSSNGVRKHGRVSSLVEVA